MPVIVSNINLIKVISQGQALPLYDGSVTLHVKEGVIEFDYVYPFKDWSDLPLAINNAASLLKAALDALSLATTVHRRYP